MRAAALTLLLALLLTAPAAAAPKPRTSLADLEDEVMCVECGTSLEVSQSPVANQERAFINQQIAAGKDKQQIKAALVQQYGKQVLAVPDGKGFNAALWVVPVAIVVLAAIGIALALRRWRRATPAPIVDAQAPALSPEDARRLDAELSR
jgi:cytochrome c-type biogenesis protein CcmH/NrfF